MPKEQIDQIIQHWFDQILKLKSGEKLTIPAADLADAKHKQRNLANLRKRYQEINPSEASQVQIGKPIVIDGRFSIRCMKLPFAQLQGFITSEAGVNSVGINPDRERLIRNMLSDGVLKKSIITLLRLDAEEIKFIFGSG